MGSATGLAGSVFSAGALGWTGRAGTWAAAVRVAAARLETTAMVKAARIGRSMC